MSQNFSSERGGGRRGFPEGEADFLLKLFVL